MRGHRFVINLHRLLLDISVTSMDAPRAVSSLALTYQGAAHAFANWLTCGVLEQFSTLRVALSEGQIGWMPFLLERLDSVWHDRPVYGDVQHLSRPPSSYLSGRVYGCVFDDSLGLALRDRIGMSQIMFEVDYPHGDSTWPNTRTFFDKIVAEAGLSEPEAYLFARGNAIGCYGLDCYGITQ